MYVKKCSFFYSNTAEIFHCNLGPDLQSFQISVSLSPQIKSSATKCLGIKNFNLQVCKFYLLFIQLFSEGVKGLLENINVKQQQDKTKDYTSEEV